MKRKQQFMVMCIFICSFSLIFSSAYASSDNIPIDRTTLLTSFDNSASDWYDDAELFAACAIGDGSGTFTDDELTTIAEATLLNSIYAAKIDSTTLMMIAFGKDEVIILGFNAFNEKAYYTTIALNDASSSSNIFMALLKEKGTFSTYKKVDVETVNNNISFLTELLTSIAD